MTRTSRGRIGALIAAVAVLALIASSEFPQAGADPDGSGGKAVAHRAGAKVVRSKSVTRKAPDAKAHYVGKNAVEPTLGVTKNGTAFYVALDGIGPNVMRSTDNGKSWKDVSPQLPAGGEIHRVTLDPYVYIDYDTSRVFNIDLTVACSYMSFSDDLGKSWTTNPVACGRPVNDHHTLFSGPPASSPTIGYKNIVYYCWNDIASSSCSKSLDGGLTFSPTGSPAFAGGRTNEGEGPPGEFCGGLHGHGTVGRDGTIYLPREYCGEPWLAISKDEGRSWTQVRVSKLEYGGGADPNVTVDAKGNLYYLFKASNNLPYLAISTDKGQTWKPSLMVGAPGVKDVNLPAIDVAAPGKIAFAYYGTTNVKITKNEDGRESRDYSTSLWNGYISMSANALSKKPLFYTSTINDPRDPIFRGNCSGNGGNRCGSVLDFIDMEIGPDGVPWAAFVDTVPGSIARIGGVAGRLTGGPNLRK